MANHLIHFVNGPCDGTTRTITQATLDRGSVVCQGTVYVNSHASPGLTGGQITFVPSTDAFVNVGKSPAHVSTAWTRWMKALARRGPESHNRIMKATVRARRIARNR